MSTREAFVREHAPRIFAAMIGVRAADHSFAGIDTHVYATTAIEAAEDMFDGLEVFAEDLRA